MMRSVNLKLIKNFKNDYSIRVLNGWVQILVVSSLIFLLLTVFQANKVYLVLTEKNVYWLYAMSVVYMFIYAYCLFSGNSDFYDNNQDNLIITLYIQSYLITSVIYSFNKCLNSFRLQNTYASTTWKNIV